MIAEAMVGLRLRLAPAKFSKKNPVRSRRVAPCGRARDGWPGSHLTQNQFSHIGG